MFIILNIIASSVFHLFVTFIGYIGLGIKGAFLTFIFPGLSAVYWFYVFAKLVGIWNRYTMICIAYLVFMAITQVLAVISHNRKYETKI